MDEGLVKIRHARSKKDFPFLKLEKDEYVEFALSRAKGCLLLALGGLALGVLIILLAFLVVKFGRTMIDEMGVHFLTIILMTLLITAIIAMAFVAMMYRGNRLFITNKHVIQTIMQSPFASSTSIIDIASIEDASYSQGGFLQTMLHYGTLRLSTVGDETTYTFKYCNVSSEELKLISKLITDKKSKTTKKD